MVTNHVCLLQHDSPLHPACHDLILTVAEIPHNDLEPLFPLGVDLGLAQLLFEFSFQRLLRLQVHDQMLFLLLEELRQDLVSQFSAVNERFYVTLHTADRLFLFHYLDFQLHLFHEVEQELIDNLC